jgi:thioredoxin reductase
VKRVFWPYWLGTRDHAPEWAKVATTVCTMTEAGHISIDAFQRTSGPGVYAAGDNSLVLRSVANSIGAGNIAGNIMNHDLITEEA